MAHLAKFRFRSFKVSFAHRSCAASPKRIGRPTKMFWSRWRTACDCFCSRTPPRYPFGSFVQSILYHRERTRLNTTRRPKTAKKGWNLMRTQRLSILECKQRNAKWVRQLDTVSHSAKVANGKASNFSSLWSFDLIIESLTKANLRHCISTKVVKIS